MKIIKTTNPPKDFTPPVVLPETGQTAGLLSFIRGWIKK